MVEFGPTPEGAESFTAPNKPPESEIPIHSNPEPEDRDMILRHAENYLYYADRERILGHTEERQGVRAVKDWIFDNLNLGNWSKVERAHREAYSGEAWEKATGIKKDEEGKVKRHETNLWQAATGTAEREKKSKFDVKLVENLARYRAALEYRDQAIKLIREKEWAEESRRKEIDQELSRYHSQLMKLAHEDSCKLLVEYEERLIRGKRNIDRTRPESKPQRTLQDIRISHPEDKTQPENKGPDLGKPGKIYETKDIGTVKGKHPPRPEAYKRWVKDRRTGEKSGRYYTRLERPTVEEPEPEKRISLPAIRKDFEKIYNNLQTASQALSKEATNAEGKKEPLKGFGIVEVSKKDSGKHYHYTEARTRSGEAGTPAAATKTICLKSMDKSGDFTELYTFSLYSDGFVVDGKRADQPRNSNDRRNENLSFKLTRTFIPTKPGLKRRSTEIIIDPQDFKFVDAHGNAWTKLLGVTEKIRNHLAKEEEISPFGTHSGADEGKTMIEHGPEYTISPEVVEETRMVGRFMEHLKSIGLEVSSQAWARLIPEIRVLSLKEHPVGAEYGINPLALISPDGKLLLDTRFERLSETQQHYVLSHELGHKLSWFLESARPEAMDQLKEQLGSLDPQEISYYSNHLRESLKDDKAKAAKLEDEYLAETIAQYLSGNRTFSGMMRAKLLQFPPESGEVSEEETVRFQALAEKVESLEGYLAYAEDPNYQADFFANHPKLAAHYQIYQSVHQIFAEPELLEKTEDFHWEEEEPFELDELVEYLHESQPISFKEMSRKAPKPSAASAKPFDSAQGKPAGLFDFINFWKIFA